MYKVPFFINTLLGKKYKINLKIYPITKQYCNYKFKNNNYYYFPDIKPL